MNNAQAAGLVIGGLIGAVTSLLTSWGVARSYFNRQRQIDKEKERIDVELSYSRLVNACFELSGKRPKHPSHVRDAMSELETKLKVYNHEFDAAKIMEQAGNQAAQTIRDNPEAFEDYPPS